MKRCHPAFSLLFCLIIIGGGKAYADSTDDSKILEHAKLIAERQNIVLLLATCNAQIEDSKQTIARERRIAEVSGTENESVLHAAGEALVDCEDYIERAYPRYRALGGTLPLDSIKTAEKTSAADQRILDAASVIKRNATELTVVPKRQAEAAEAARRKAAMDAMMAAEQQSRIQAAQADWGQAMAARIRKFWERPPAAPDDFSCAVAMQLAPDGQVQSAKVVNSCGDAQLDRSVEAAVIKASPLPLPPEPKAFVPNVTVNFTPHAS